LLKQQKIVTNQDYDSFLKELAQLIKTLAGQDHISATGVAAPGKIDRKSQIALDFGNLPWHHVALAKDLSPLTGHTPVYIENDANLGGLSEAKLVQDKYKKVIYLSVSTGIGDGIIINGIIDADFADSEPGQMVWEDFASGRALLKKYGKRASDIEDPAIWKDYVRGLASGIGELAAILTPEVFIMGGGVGDHLEKFEVFLNDELKKYQNKLVNIPPIIKAKRPEEAVIYGCYELIKQQGFA
jgi:predicted NBD/HSP70 family sugar kinase